MPQPNQLINPQSFLSTLTVSLETLLANGYLLVPDYQRDYSWTEDEITVLWQDLLATAQGAFSAAGGIVTSPSPHFLGVIVIETNPPERSEVIDGQQRLVTLTALASVLVEFASAIEDSQLRDAWMLSLKNLIATHVGGELSPRLQLARGDAHYQELVCRRYDKAARDSYRSQNHTADVSVLDKLHKCVSKLNELTEAYIGSILDTAKRDRSLVELIRSVTQLTLLLRMEVHDDSVAYEVFERLNDRGLGLSQADLIKNKLFALAESEGTKGKVAQSWEKTVAAVERQSLIDLTEFFFFHFVAKHKEIKKNDLYTEIVRLLKPGGLSAQAYAIDVAKTAVDLVQVIEGGVSLAGGAERDIESVTQIFPNRYALTLLIAGLHKHTAGSPEFGWIAKLTHNFVFRRFHIEGTKLGAYATEISDVARKFVAGILPDHHSVGAALSQLSLDQTFRSRFRDFVAPSNALGFYVIEMIENHCSAGAGVSIQRRSPAQHLEHVMPRKPGMGWEHVSGQQAEHEKFLNRIGNLLALEAKINRFIKNKDINTKRENEKNKDYAHSVLTLPHAIDGFLQDGIWTFQSIEERQKHLADTYALHVWSLSVPGASDAPGAESGDL